MLYYYKTEKKTPNPGVLYRPCKLTVWLVTNVLGFNLKNKDVFSFTGLQY